MKKISKDQEKRLTDINNRVRTKTVDIINDYIDGFQVAKEIADTPDCDYSVTVLFSLFLPDIAYETARNLWRVKNCKEYSDFFSHIASMPDVMSKVAYIGGKCFNKDNSLKKFIDVEKKSEINGKTIRPIDQSFKEFKKWLRHQLGEKPTEADIFTELLERIKEIEMLDIKDINKDALNESLETIQAILKKALVNELYAIAKKIRLNVAIPLNLNTDQVKTYIDKNFSSHSSDLVRFYNKLCDQESDQANDQESDQANDQK